MDVSVRIELDPIGRIGSEKETGLFRIAQEALTNVVRHARATEVSIRIEQGASGPIKLMIGDDGEGFTPDEKAPASLGLRSMCERADILGGTCTVESRPGRGSTVSVTVPA